MRISTSIIASLARGVLGAIPEVGDDVADIGHNISPIIKLLRPTAPTTVFTQSDQSFFIIFQAQSRTVGVQSVNGPVFAKGLWRLNLSAQVITNWDDSPSNTAQAYLSILAPNAVKASIAGFHSGLATFTSIVHDLDLEMLFPDDGYTLVWDLAATAAGQITIAECGVVATKLL